MQLILKDRMAIWHGWMHGKIRKVFAEQTAEKGPIMKPNETSRTVLGLVQERFRHRFA